MLPPSAQAAVRDVDAAYRTIPLHPSQWPGTVLHDEQSNFYIDYCLGFGLSPAAGAWGLVADASADIMRRNGVAVVLKWVDDFIFITVPLGDLHLANQSLRQRRFNTLPQAHHRGGAAYFLTQEGEEQADDGFGSFRNLTGATLPHQLVTSFNAIDNITKPLGLPWKASKDRDFATTQQYTGFVFDIPARTVHLPDTKRQRYLENVCAWMRRPRSTLAQADTLLGQLQHAAFVHSAGRKRLAYLRQFQAVNSHHHREAPLHPPRQLHSDLLWHTALSDPDRRRCFAADTTTRDLQLYTDASEWGVGVFIGNDIYSLPFSHNIPTPFSVLWAEALAFEIGLRIAIDRGAADCALPVHCDNAAVVASSQSGYMRHQSVMLILQRIRILEAQANIDVCPTYVRSEHNLPTLHHVGNRGTNHLPHLYTSHPPLPTTSHTMSSLIDDHIRAALDILQSRTRPATTPTPSSVTSPALASISTRTHNPTTPRPPRPHLTTRALPPAVSRPDVPAAQRLLAWIPPNRPQLPPFHDPERVSRTLMASWAKSTLDSYASAVLQWYAWATAVDLPEQLIFPIKPRTLVDFIANSAGIYNGKTISKWVSGLRAYHIIHGAHLKSQDETVKQALRGAARQTPATAIKPPRIPYTAAILIALRPAFHLGDPFDAAVWVC